MISFIVVGQNEGWKLALCFQSILYLVDYNKVKRFEIIYIDSNSTDDSIEIAKEFEKVKVYKLISDANAAIARNVGAEKSKGEVLFFIDGDMEVMKSVYSLIFDKNELKRDYVSGNWINYFYDKNDVLLYKKKFLNINTDKLEATTGGLFVIKKETWNSVGGMRSKFKKSQDIDLGLRLAKKGILLLRKKEPFVNHHTISYRNDSRIWKELFNGKHLYGRSLIYRDHVFNKYIYPRFIRNEYSLIVFIISLFLSCFFGFHYGFVIYILLIIIRSKLKMNIMIYFMIRDLMTLGGVFFFYPKKNFNIKVKEN